MSRDILLKKKLITQVRIYKAFSKDSKNWVIMGGSHETVWFDDADGYFETGGSPLVGPGGPVPPQYFGGS